MTASSRYRLKVTSAACTEYSNEILVTFGGTSTISGQPSNRSICEGASTTFVVASSGALTYKWQVNTGSGFTDLAAGGVYSGVATNTLTITGATVSMNGYIYRAVVTNTCSAISNSATLSISTAPLGGMVSGSSTVCTGTNSTLLTLSGHKGVITKWQSSNDMIFTTPVDIVNTTTTFTANNLTATTYYRAVLTSAGCTSLNSLSGLVTVNPLTFTWIGTTDTQWGTASNWSCGVAPSSSTHDVTIPNTTNKPVIRVTPTAIVRNLSITGNTASLTITGVGALQVYGNWSNAGTFNAGTSTIEFLGSAAQIITNSSVGNKETFYNLTLNKTNPSEILTLGSGTLVDIAANGSVKLTQGVLDLNSNTFTLKSGAPTKVGSHLYDNTARLLAINATTSSIANDGNFTMERYVPTVAGKFKSRMIGTCIKNMPVSQWAASFPILGGAPTTGFLLPTATSLWTWKRPTSSTLFTYVEGNTLTDVSHGFTYVTDNTTIANIGQGFKTFIGYNPEAKTNPSVSPYSTGASTSDTIVMKGSVQTGNVNVPITIIGGGWNFVSNPYPCEIDWKLLYAQNSTIISNAVYILDPETKSLGSTYFSCQIIDGNANPVDPRFPGLVKRDNPSIIGSSQGFFVHSSSSSTVNLAFTESMKITTPVLSESNFRMESSSNTLNIRITNGIESDNTFLYFKDDAKDGLDEIYDIDKLENSTMSIFTNSFGKNLAFNGIKPNFKDLHVPVIVASGYRGTHTLTVEGANTVDKDCKIYLLDAYTNQNIELGDVTKYEFEIDGNTATSSKDRFAIVSDFDLTVTGLINNNSANAPGLTLYPNPLNNEPLNVSLNNVNNESFKVEILDEAGVTVYKQSFHSLSSNNSLVINDLSNKLTNGIYVVKVIGNTQVTTKKLVFHK